ncbi:Dic1p [Sugiyamaella lignohabitans]|uniref:Dic1p n=1 Tax=Sugiyamaella lignohabitans TaxID=796027 RepID=A0A167FE65_9ASCO|nr:Dic1p [Sugiyamaella lignohabitans]ANB15186.1 Dic1p [Sugiyamaella lignohabitans]
MVAASCTHPLDLAKVRMQTAARPGANMFGTLLGVVKNEGLLAIYQGLSASLLRQATYSTTRFGVYEYLKEAVSTDKSKPPSTSVLLPISMFSGLVGGIVGNPADVVNIRMQNDKSCPPELRRNYRNAFDGVRRIIVEEGPKALFRGLVPNCVRGVLMTASQVVSYDRMKYLLVSGFGMDEKKRSTHFSASLLAGLVATTVCSPADVVKTRIMNAASNSDSAFGILVKAVKSEGILFAFRGWLPAFIRLGPQTIVTFLVLEQLKASGLGQKRPVLQQQSL